MLEAPVVAAAMSTAVTHGFVFATMLTECFAALAAHVATTFLGIVVVTWLLKLECFGMAWMGRNWLGVLVAGWVWQKCLLSWIDHTSVFGVIDSTSKVIQ